MLCYVQLFYKGEGKTTKQPLRPLQKVCEVKKKHCKLSCFNETKPVTDFGKNLTES